jgi:hypothetical protein
MFQQKTAIVYFLDFHHQIFLNRFYYHATLYIIIGGEEENNTSKYSVDLLSKRVSIITHHYLKTNSKAGLKYNLLELTSHFLLRISKKSVIRFQNVVRIILFKNVID